MTLAERFFKEELELEKQKIESPNNRKQKTGDFQIGIKNGRRNSRREVQRNERNGRNRDEKNKFIFDYLMSVRMRGLHGRG